MPNDLYVEMTLNKNESFSESNNFENRQATYEKFVDEKKMKTPSYNIEYNRSSIHIKSNPKEEKNINGNKKKLTAVKHTHANTSEGRERDTKKQHK